MTLPLAAAPDPALILLLAVALDAAVGDPAWLYRRVPHPVALLGRMVGWLDRELNHEGAGAGRRRLAGVAAHAAGAGLAALVGWALSAALRQAPFGWIVEAALLGTLIAQRGLYDHVAAVADALARDGLGAGRAA
ncbi:MAG: cobalamin biosynthesis protein, partial [Dongiaceae bacterium]